MAWTAPKTWSPELGVTAAELNTHVRDQLLELGPAKATAAGQILMSAGTHEVAMRGIVSDQADSVVTTTSTSPTTLGGGTPSVSVTHGGAFLIYFASRMRKLSGTGVMNCGPAVVGEAGYGAVIGRAVRRQSDKIARFAGHVLHFGLEPGTHTVRLEYWTSNGEAEYAHRTIAVWPL